MATLFADPPKAGRSVCFVACYGRGLASLLVPRTLTHVGRLHYWLSSALSAQFRRSVSAFRALILALVPEYRDAAGL